MEDLPLLPVLLPRSRITAAPPSSPSSSSSDEDGDEVDDDAVGGSVGGDGDVGAGDGGASGSDVDAMSVDGGRVGGGEVGDEGGGPAKLVWQFKWSVEDPCVVEGVVELCVQVTSIEASLAQVEVLLVVLVEDLEDQSQGFSRKRCCGLEE